VFLSIGRLGESTTQSRALSDERLRFRGHIIPKGHRFLFPSSEDELLVTNLGFGSSDRAFELRSLQRPLFAGSRDHSFASFRVAMYVVLKGLDTIRPPCFSAGGPMQDVVELLSHGRALLLASS